MFMYIAFGFLTTVLAALMWLTVVAITLTVKDILKLKHREKQRVKVALTGFPWSQV